jgi:hypothetical protein
MSDIEEAPKPKVTEYPRSCSTCMHVRTCKAFAMAVGMNKSFNEANDFVNLLQDPQLIALGCKEYLSPISKSEYGI